MRPTTGTTQIPTKAESMNNDALLRLKDIAKQCAVTLDDLITSLVRNLIIPKEGHKLVCVDVSAIEARMLAWMTNDPNVDLFRQGKDVYCAFASQLYGHEVTKAKHPDKRDVGKVAELQCGYGSGGPKLGVTALANGVDLKKAGVDNPQDLVYAYRDTHPLIAGTWNGQWFDPGEGRDPLRVYKGGLWKDIEKAMWAVTAGETDQVSLGYNDCLTWVRVGDDTNLVLPSGREIVYRDARIEEAMKFGEMRDCIVFTKRMKDGREQRVTTYGGKLTENGDQGACWDYLNLAHVKAEDNGFAVVLEVHDELVLEVPENEAEEACDWLVETMSASPAWAPDFPVAAEGAVLDYYTKVPLKGWYQKAS